MWTLIKIINFFCLYLKRCHNCLTHRASKGRDDVHSGWQSNRLLGQARLLREILVSVSQLYTTNHHHPSPPQPIFIKYTHTPLDEILFFNQKKNLLKKNTFILTFKIKKIGYFIFKSEYIAAAARKIFTSVRFWKKKIYFRINIKKKRDISIFSAKIIFFSQKPNRKRRLFLFEKKIFFFLLKFLFL